MLANENASLVCTVMVLADVSGVCYFCAKAFLLAADRTGSEGQASRRAKLAGEKAFLTGN